MAEAWVYMLRCRDGSYYTGWTSDLERRLRRHRAGRASRYTKSRLPVELALALNMPDRTAARREEARIKSLSRRQKLLLLEREAIGCGYPSDSTTPAGGSSSVSLEVPSKPAREGSR